MSTFVLQQDPALQARTFSNNPTLSKALARLAQRNPPSSRTVSTGAEVPGGTDAQDNRPTDEELNDHYLIVHGWIRFQPDHPDNAYWIDPKSGLPHFTLDALLIQNERDLRRGWPGQD